MSNSELGGFTRDEPANAVRNLLQPRSKLPKSKLKILFYVIVGIVILFGVASIFGDESSSSLQVVRIGRFNTNDNKALIITNIGEKLITITKITINNRDDCVVVQPSFLLFDKEDPPKMPMQLKVGDKTILAATCGIVRTTIASNEGSYTYSFK